MKASKDNRHNKPSNLSKPVTTKPLPTPTNYYVEITPNAIGRLFFDTTPVRIVGLYTLASHTSCMIAIQGELGISLIHTTGKLPTDSILDEFKNLGKIKSWTIAYDANFYTSDEFFKKLPFLSRAKKTAGNLDFKLMSLGSNSHLGFNRKGEITQNKISMKPLDGSEQRMFINFLNYCYDGVSAPVDIQFDGKKPTRMPVLSTTVENMALTIALRKQSEEEETIRLAYLFDSYFICYLRLYDIEKLRALYYHRPVRFSEEPPTQPVSEESEGEEEDFRDPHAVPQEELFGQLQQFFAFVPEETATTPTSSPPSVSKRAQ